MNATRFYVHWVPLLAALVATPAFSEAHDCLGEVHQTILTHMVQGWGTLGMDSATAAPGQPPAALRIGETVYDHGIGHHAPGELVYTLPPGAWTAFSAEVGVQWQGGGKGSVVFQVFVDGECRFDSGLMTDSDAPKSVEVSLAGAHELRLVSGDGGDGISCDMADWALARLHRDLNALRMDPPSLLLGGTVAPTPSAAVAGFALIAREDGPQVARLGDDAFALCVRDGETVESLIPVANAPETFTLKATVDLLQGDGVDASLSVNGGTIQSMLLKPGANQLSLDVTGAGKDLDLRLRTRGSGTESLVRWRDLQWVGPAGTLPLRALPEASAGEVYPPPLLPALRPAMESMLIEWDWRMQDGIGTRREAVSYATAIDRLLTRGDRLVADLQGGGALPSEMLASWQGLRDRCSTLASATTDAQDPAWEQLWRETHVLRRQIALANPLADVGPLLFTKHVSSDMSHQLTQYYGRCARPGGGLFVLDAPGRSMATRGLTTGHP